MILQLLNFSRRSKQLILMLVDSLILIAILLAAFSIRLGFWYFPSNDLIWVIFAAPIFAVVIFSRFGLYHTVIRYIGFEALWSVIIAVSLYSLIWSVVAFMVAIGNIPRSVILINWLLAIIAITGVRVFASWLLGRAGKYVKQKRVAIYGAGAAGRQLMVALQQSSEYNPLFFIDDTADLHKQIINGVKVESPDVIEHLIEKHQISEILLAMPSVSRSRLREVLDFLVPYAVVVRSLPGVVELAQGKVNVADLKSPSIQDLLGRNTVAASHELLSQNIVNKVVMVTGAGGSIGSELCRQIVRLKPKALVLYEMNELALYNINQELLDAKIAVYPLLGSVNNKARLVQLCRHFCVQTIYHAAAYKHVPMVEFNNAEGVNNNIFGTLSCAQAAIDASVETFVLISTDKAVRPTNTMGATKRCAELILQALSATQKSTKFSMVRFGNVLGSSGSVVPLFTRQIKEGGPITVTDENIIRYFMTMPEAVELVIQAGAMGSGGDVFVLDMGEPVRIVDLAKKMIRLSGLQVKDATNPTGDIEIEYTGLRPGEKLFEELLISDNVSTTDNPMIMRAQENGLPWDELDKILRKLQMQADDNNAELLRKLLIQVVSDFKPQCEVVDLLYRH